MRKKKPSDEEIIMEIYQKIYEVSEPPANFSELVKNASTNQQGQKVIEYDKYYCPQKLMIEIIDNVLNKYKVSKFKQQAFRATILLGCSPRSI